MRRVATASLDASERAAFANPFGHERAELDLAITKSHEPLRRDRRLELLVRKLKDWLARLERSGRIDRTHSAPSDRATVETVFLLDARHALSGPFDELIRQQLAAGANPCPVPFAAEAFQRLRRRGFSPGEACQHFAMLFQLRRAYYFIQHRLVGKSECLLRLRRQLAALERSRDARSRELRKVPSAPHGGVLHAPPR